MDLLGSDCQYPYPVAIYWSARSYPTTIDHKLAIITLLG